MANDRAGKSEEILQSIAEGNVAVLDQLKRMVEGSYEDSGLDPQTFVLVRLAALIAMDAAPASWMLNLAVGKELDMSPDLATGTLIAVAPIVGSARVVSAAGNIVKALALAKLLRDSK